MRTSKTESLAQLNPGITGFSKTGEHIPTVDVKSFKQDCFKISNDIGITVVVEDKRSVISNFITACFFSADSSTAALLNYHYPIIAFSRTSIKKQQNFLIEFIDDKKLETKFKEIGGYHVLSKMGAEEPLNSFELGTLPRYEIKQIEYWKPKCIGHLVFNYWD